MAEPEDSIAKAPHKLFRDLGSPRPLPIQQKPYRCLVDLLSRVASFIVFAALLTAFPSQAPEFVNIRGWWELLHLLLVGIAASYGLFSRRNYGDPASDKEALHRGDAPHRSCVSQLLQVSSVFEEEEEEEQVTRCVPHHGDKLQAWSSQYHRLEPAVMVQAGDHKSRTDPARPLLLPIRSLIRSRIPDVDESPGGNRGGGQRVAHPGAPSCSSSKKSNCRVDSGGVGEVADQSLEDPSPPSPLKEGLTGSAALPSPVPWQYSRSARTQTRNETRGSIATAAPPPLSSSLPPSAHRAPSSHPSNSGASTTLRRRLSPSPPHHSPADQMRAKAGEDCGKKWRTFYKPPPPPPPPPPFLSHKTPYRHPSSSSDRKDDKRSFKDQLKDFGGRNGDRGGDGRLGSRGSRFDSKPRIPVEGYSPGMPVRTVVTATKEAVQGGVTAGRPPEPKSVRFPAQTTPSLTYKHRRDREFKPTEDGERGRLKDRVVLETEDSESDEASEVASDVGDLPSKLAEDENEVDKKADEFIAKFREQIRLQRIDSIRRSAEQCSLRNDPE